MSTTGPACTEVDPATSRQSRPLFGWSLAFLATLVVCELLLLSVRFNAITPDGPWSRVVGALPLTGAVGHVAIAALAAVVLLRGDHLRSALVEIAGRTQPRHVFWAALVAHLACVIGFYRLTAVVFEGGPAAAAHAGWWLAAWLFAGVLAAVSWFVAVVPTADFSSIVRGTFRWLLPCVAIGAAAWAAGSMAETLWPPLAQGTFVIVEALLRPLYSNLISQPEELILGTSDFRLQIAPMCSGYEGMGLVTVFLGVFLWVYRGKLRFPRALVLLPLGVAAIWLSNSLRIALLIIIGASYSSEVAMGGFHSQAGWLAFNAVTLGLIALAWNSTFFSKSTAAQPATRSLTTNYPAAPYLLPLLVLIASVMVTSAFASGPVNTLYPLRVVAAAAALAWFWPYYRRSRLLEWSWSWTPVAIGALVFVIWIALEPLAGISDVTRAEQSVAVAGMSTSMAAVWLVLRTLGSVVTVPLCEELAFRGFLTRRLLAEDFEQVPLNQFSWFSLVVSSIAFGALHESRWLAGTIAGVLLALAMYRRGRLIDAVIAHSTANGLVSAYALATGNWAAWS